MELDSPPRRCSYRIAGRNDQRVPDQSKLGTAFGIWRAFNNSGSTIMDIVFGVLQDGTDNMGYDKVLILSITLKTVAFLLGCGYIFIDYRFLGKGMTLSEKARTKREEEIEDRDADPLTARPVNLYVTKTALGLLFGIVVSAWVIFLKYLIDPSSQ
ncbi:hypothetical protein BDY24DRAFT_372763 [Mrakia frigida]|uniref:uncharacterized protein n=1 Tax=Mrakia frigida TaxID=29902 RepID=UPI003FCC0635